MIVLALVLSAFAVGLDNFAAAIGIGMSGVDARTRLRVAAIFGFFEATMPLVGLLIGHSSAHSLGQATRYVGGGLLAAAGLWSLVEALRTDGADATDDRDASQRAGHGSAALLVSGLALSIDNLVIGFGLGVTKTPLVASPAGLRDRERRPEPCRSRTRCVPGREDARPRRMGGRCRTDCGRGPDRREPLLDARALRE